MTVKCRCPRSTGERVATPEFCRCPLIDARNFVLLGDPAARLVVDAAPPGAKTTPLSQTRPAIQPVSISGPVPSSRLTAPAPVETPIKTMLAFNGLDAATGKPLFAGISMDEVIQMILDERASPDAGKLTSLRRRPAQRGML